MPPDRAPTIRSVSEIVSKKLVRAPMRTFSTPRNRATDIPIDKIVIKTVNRRVNKEANASRKIILLRRLSLPVEKNIKHAEILNVNVHRD